MNHNPETGEVLQPDDTSGSTARAVIAHDGKPRATRSNLISDVIRMVEDGQFNLEASQAMVDLVKKMEAHAHNNKGVAKGKITLDLNFTLGNHVFVIVPDCKVKAPVERRSGTPVFLGEDGSLGKNPTGHFSSLTNEDRSRRIARDV